MEKLEYVEKRAADTLLVLRQSYDDLHERAYKLATVLVGGGGAVGAYALGQFQPGGSVLAWAPLAALALSWWGVAIPLMWTGATTTKLSPGNGPKNLLSYFEDRRSAGAGDQDAFRIMREAELNLQQQRIDAFSAGCVARADAIDYAYKAVVICSPAVPLLVAAACLWF